MQEKIMHLIEEFEARLKSLKDEYEEDKAECEFGKGDFCWVISESGSLTGSAWRGDEYNEDCYEQGNVFKIKEEALFEVEKRKVLHELRMMGKPFVRGKFNLVIYMEDENIIISRAILNILYGNYYFRTKDEAENAIKKIGEDRIKKYLFGIDEE